MPAENARTPNRSYFTPSPRLLTWITKVHRGLYRATGGLLGATLFQVAEPGTGFLLRPMPMLLLTTTGRKSGIARTVPLPYFEYDGRLFLVASNAGGPENPAWFRNLEDQPRVTAQVGRDRRERRAVALAGEERAAIFARIVGDWPRYGIYQTATAREIPVVELMAAGRDAPC